MPRASGRCFFRSCNSATRAEAARGAEPPRAGRSSSRPRRHACRPRWARAAAPEARVALLFSAFESPS
jgi:hypothetical protein